MKASAIGQKQRTKFDASLPAVATRAADIMLAHLQAELQRVDVLIQDAVLRWKQVGRDPEDAFRGLVVSDGDAAQLAALPLGGDWGDLAANGANDELERVVRERHRAASRQVAATVAQAAQVGVPLRLPQLVQSFGLSDFERDALLICLAPALDLRYEQIFSFLQNDINRKLPTVNLLLRLLGGHSFARLQHLARFAPDAPLLRHRLLEYTDEPGHGTRALLAQGLAVDRTVLHWLLGEYHPHTNLAAHVQVLPPADGRAAQEALALLDDEVRIGLDQAASLTDPIVLLIGPDAAAKQLAAQAFAGLLERPLITVAVDRLIEQGVTATNALRPALRDAQLNQAVLLLTGWDACVHDRSTPVHLQDMLFAHHDAVLVASRGHWLPEGVDRPRPVLTLDFEPPDYALRRRLWAHYLARQDALVEGVDPVELAAQFTLTTGQIRDAVASGRDRGLRRGGAPAQADFFAGARLYSGARLGDMARKITPRYGWDDIILPDDQVEILRELVATVRARAKVLEEWGLGRKLASSHAVTVLFAGPPGTGKTMAAEVIASDLGLDLYKIDLSGLVSKYIGETEKNLERVFTEAQSSNAILFFDEADSIFGKRSGVKDAHDRYANLEISYLLQRMEVYDGVTILATNLRSNIDEAFLRRLQFAVDVPFPDEKQRLRIWETLFPPGVPKGEDVDLEEMARRYKLAGGNIRNILLSAAFLAASDGGVITMQHLLHGARREFQKMGRLVLEG